MLTTCPDAGVLRYEEGPDIGHRAWLRSGTAPAYWFGHGLGYTQWEYEELSLPDAVGAGEAFDVQVRLRNTGSRRGREVVQVYLSRPASGAERPVRRLIGYAAVEADPGQSAVATVRVAGRAAAHWSTVRSRWETDPGEVRLLAGRSAGDLPLEAGLALGEPLSGHGPIEKGERSPQLLH